MKSPYNSIGLVDRPFSPSGIPKVDRRYRVVGLDKELNELAKVADFFLRGSDNMLVVVIGPYGFGKSDLLDEFEAILRDKGFDVVRVALNIGLDVKDFIRGVMASRDSSRPMAVIFDEADELTRAYTMAGGIDDRVRGLIMEASSIVRALVEPRSYAHMLGLKPTNLAKVLIVAAFTPQLYYNILKNTLPDIFDIARGRVFREVLIDDRVPYWLYESIVASRLEAYSTEDRVNLVRKGAVDPLWPLTREQLTLIYLVARRMENGQVSPRNLIKLTSKLLDRAAEVSRPLSIGEFKDLLKEELKGFINIDLLNELEKYGDEVLRVALSGIPVKAHQSVELSQLVERVIVVDVDPQNPNELAKVNNLRMLYGMPPIVFKDLKDLSIEYASYYTVVNGDKVRLMVILPADANVDGLNSIGGLYILKKNIHDRLLNASAGDGKALSELSQLIRYSSTAKPIDIASNLASIIIKDRVIASENGLRVGIVDKALDARLAYVIVDEQGDIGQIISNCGIRINGSFRPLDGLVVFAVSDKMLTEELKAKFSKLPKWCGVYDSPARVLVIPYGSDLIDELRITLIGLGVLERFSKVPGEYSRHVEYALRLIEKINAFKESLRSTIIQYTLGIPKRKEGKREVLKQIVLAWANDDAGAQIPESFKCSGRPCITRVEEVLRDYLRGIEKPLDGKELEQVIRSLFPVHLWRDVREQDLIELMLMRGLIYEVNGRYLCTCGGRFSKAVEALCSRIARLKEASQRPITINVGDIKLELKPSTVELAAKISELEDECKIMSAILSEPGEQDLKKYSKIYVDALNLQDEVEALASRDESLVKEVKVVAESVISMLNSIKSKLIINDDELKACIEQRVSNVSANVAKALKGLNNIPVSKAFEALRSIKANTEAEAQAIENITQYAASILSYINEEAVLVNLVSRIAKLLSVKDEYDKPNPADVKKALTELACRGSVKDLEVVVAEYEERVKEVKAKLVKYSTELTNIVHVLNKRLLWMRHRGIVEDSVEVSDVDPTDIARLESSINAIEEALRLVDSKLDELSRKTKVPRQVIEYVSSQGPNVGLDEVEMAKALGISSDKVLNYLEALWRARLVDRRYVS